MLQRIHLRNFKSHRDTELILDDSRLHALVGQNSAGKTSVLQALHYLCRLADSPFRNIFWGERAPNYVVSMEKSEATVCVSGFWGYVNRQVWTAGYLLDKNDLRSSKILWEMDDEDSEMSGWNSSLKEAPSPIPQALRYAVHLKLVASNLASAAYSDELTPGVEYDGSGLAPTLDYLRAEAPDKFQELQHMLQRIVSGVQNVDVRRAKVNRNRQRSIEVDGRLISYEESQEITGQEVVVDMNTGERIPAHAVSEGTILTLGLLTVLMNPKQPNLVLLDDVEQGLHPKAQRELISVFGEIVNANPNLQIIFSTHSPYIIDALDPSQVHVLSNTAQGYTSVKRLDEHPDIEWAKNSLTTGEFWDAEGEDWVVAGEIGG